ncbi:MAG: LPS export ABC transporter ATP-binding protein [Spirochaetales bacterium]|nr:LPS export ABC transporter ATP-binding protein [Spirochaetales bacterium]
MNNEETRVLRVENLRKRYKSKIAVKDVSFEMKTGEIVGLLGPNGAGKTTIFYMIVGFIDPTQGSIYFEDDNITKFPMYKRARKGIAYLPQEPSVFRNLTVRDNIWAILETRKDLNKIERKRELEFLLEELNITEITNRKAYKLSGGERRRTEIARSLAINPKFLLLDEPFAGIDPIAISEIKGIIKDLASKNIGILITDHNARDTLDITDRLYIINLGDILVSGTPAELVNNDLAREIYLGKDFSM